MNAGTLTRVLRAALLLMLVAGSFVQMRTGLADNGDFSRVMTWISSGPSGFTSSFPAEGTEEYQLRFWSHSVERWRLDFPLRSRWASAVLLLWLPGIVVNMLLHSSAELWLPWLSLGARLFTIAFLLVLFRWIDRTAPHRRSALTLVVCVPFALYAINSDTVAYFTSMYQEPGVFASLLAALAIVWRVRTRPPSARSALLAAFAALLLGTSKISNLYWPMLIFLAVMPWRTLRTDRRIARWYFVAVLIVPVFITLVQAALVGSRRDNAYQSLYCGVLTFSGHPDAHLARLGLDSTAAFIREPAYTPRARAFITAQPGGFSHAATLDVIAHEPAVAARMLVFAADSMQRMTLAHLGTDVLVNDTLRDRPWRIDHPIGAGRSGVLAAWSTLKRTAFPRGPHLLAALALLAVLFAILMRLPGRTRTELARIGLLCTAACAIDMWLQVFGDGRQDLVKHLFLPNLLWDVSVVTALAALAAGRGQGGRVPSPAPEAERA